MNRLGVRKLKIMALGLTLLMPATIIDASTSDYKLDNKVTLINDNDSSIKNIEYSKKSIVIETTTTTSLTTTIVTTPTTTIPVTTIPPVDIYKDIRFLEDVSNNDLTIEELNKFIIKYSSLAHYSYYDALDIIKNNLDSINKDYDSIKGGIMCTLFETASENNVLSGYCDSSIIELRNMTLEEQESIMLEMCDNLSLTTDEKLIVLAIFRHETGNGESNLCLNCK